MIIVVNVNEILFVPTLFGSFDEQNPEDKREIICDEKLKAVMGGKDRVTMFTMNKYVGSHLLEKLDKSYYTHEED